MVVWSRDKLIWLSHTNICICGKVYKAIISQFTTISYRFNIYLCLHHIASILTQFHYSTIGINNIFFTSSLKFNIYYYECPSPANSSTIKYNKCYATLHSYSHGNRLCSVVMYLQWISNGRWSPQEWCCLTRWMKPKRGVAWGGTPKSGHAVKWNSLTILMLSLPSYIQIQALISFINIIP